jgi:hypothetical protein
MKAVTHDPKLPFPRDVNSTSLHVIQGNPPLVRLVVLDDASLDA